MDAFEEMRNFVRIVEAGSISKAAGQLGLAKSRVSRRLAELEGGTGAVVTNTGMSAVVLVTYLLEPGDTIVAPNNCYGGCYRAFDSLARLGRFQTIFSDFSDLDDLRRVCRVQRPKIIWVETPSNPLLRVVDLAAVAALAAPRGVITDQVAGLRSCSIRR